MDKLPTVIKRGFCLTSDGAAGFPGVHHRKRIDAKKYRHPFMPEKEQEPGPEDCKQNIVSFKTPETTFKLWSQAKVNGRFPLQLYTSDVTGMKLAMVDVPGPVVFGYFTLATEAHDDDGLPHTLEHLVFMGSDSYPFKGILDMLANRCLSSGTNAWTDTDHTAYTMTTGGADGFVRLLPIYLDHILFPELRDSAFVTEVHHVNGEGEDAGVVYAEMQSKENSGNSVVSREVFRALYPGHCGYKSETGGMMKNLRESTNNAKVTQYHRDFYRPENLFVLITGRIRPEQVLEHLAKFDCKVVLKKCDEKWWPEGFERPWFAPVPPFTECVDKEVSFPADEEDNGLVVVGYRGPSVVVDQYRIIATEILLDYLTDTALSPLEKRFVNREVPLASEVSSSIVENAASIVLLEFNDVPLDSLGQILPALQEEVRALADPSYSFDMDRMRTLILKEQLRILNRIENEPHDSTAEIMIQQFLYGSLETLQDRLDYPAHLAKLECESAEFWKNLFVSLFVGQPFACVRGRPSIERKRELQQEEEERFKERRKAGGLKKRAKQLEKAVEINEEPVPDIMLTSMPVATTDGINFHEISSYSSWNNLGVNPLFPFDGFPNEIPFRLCDADTHFVKFMSVVDVSTLPEHLRPLLPLYVGVITESPVVRPNGTKLTYEEVVKGLERDTLSVSGGIGVGDSDRFNPGKFTSYMTIFLKVELKKYVEGIGWLQDLLFNTQMEEERLLVEANRIINSVAQERKSGEAMTKYLHSSCIYPKGSYVVESAPLRQQEFLQEFVLDVLNSTDPELKKKLFDDLAAIKTHLTKTGKLQIHMATNLKRLLESLGEFIKNASSPWTQKFFPAVAEHRTLWKEPKCEKLLTVWDRSLLMTNPEPSRIMPLGSVDSSYMIMSVQTSITSYFDPSFAPLCLAIQYISQVEGPLWRQVRGKGYCYYYNISVKLDEGLLYLVLEECTHVVKAFNVTKKAVLSTLGKKKLNSEAFEAARSSLIFEIIQNRETIGDVIRQSFMCVFKDISQEFDRGFIHKIWTCREEEVLEAANRFLPWLFEPGKSRFAIVCPPNKTKEIRSGFSDVEVEVFDSVEASPLVTKPSKLLPVAATEAEGANRKTKKRRRNSSGACDG